jgi:uncharacterized protein with ParB-like and HNH nuclease domain
MQAVKLSFADLLKIEGNVEHYHIPKYQREYIWGKSQWETLINDINENEPEYFIGSVIVVNHSTDLKPGEEKIYQVIDGQQRLTTISILLLAIYFCYKEYASEVEENDDEQKTEFTITLDSIKRKLIKKKKSIYPYELGSFKDEDNFCFLRVQPSTQNSNLADYKLILKDCGLLKVADHIKNKGNRRFWKAYEFFYDQLPDTKRELDILLDKINRLVFIHISVSSQADAFTLFETLNNRGVDLSPIDIIKNSLLAEMEKQHNQEIDQSYDEWQILLGNIPDFENQIRFLRQYYNAFKTNDLIKHEKITRATKSNVLQIYERLIKKNANFAFKELLSKSEYYGRLTGNLLSESNDFNTKIIELNRVGAVSSYTLLLFLLSNQEHLENETVLLKIVDFIIKYYVRRNVTDTPNTRDLDAMTIEVVEACNKQINDGGKISLELVTSGHLNNSKAKPANITDFKKWLSDFIYSNNVGMTRYLLWKLDNLNHTREYAPDLWQRNPNNDTYVWTIEHILPEGNNIPKNWVEMIADGNEEKAKVIQGEIVHLLGNLTLSAYNSNLSNRSFKDKQNLSFKKVGNQELKIGYKNGLSLNNFKFGMEGAYESLSTIDKWAKESILSRTEEMVERLAELFAFDYEQ